MGTLHVLTGPDHLSALATLSSTDLGSRTKQREDLSTTPRGCDFRAFLLGVRWGIGHSIGLLIVGGILICIQEGTTGGEWIGLDNWVTSMLETFVGVFMICLGVYGITKALANKGWAASRSPSSTPRRKSWSSSHSSGAGTIPVENKGTMKNRILASRNNLVMAGSSEIDLPPHRGGHDPIQMNALSDESDAIDRSVSDNDRRLWNAAKNLPDGLASYASRDYMSDDDLSCSKSRADSVVTIPMNSMTMNDLHRLYDDVHSTDMDVNLNNLFVDPRDVDEDNSTLDLSNRSFTMATATGDGQERSIENMPHMHIHRSRCAGRCLLCKPSALALLAGLIHGVAGPGGVLGIIPAVQMQDVGLAMTYLGTFCITSTLVMGGFASFYGKMCYWMAEGEDKNMDSRMNRVFLVEIGSACLSVIVGIVWLTLLAVGELNEVFP